VKVRLQQLSLVCKKATEVVKFEDVSYFYGEIGAGKSSIVHLVDYCLGGDLRETPALQSEFVEAELTLRVGDSVLTLTRAKGATHLHAAWQGSDGPLDVIVPARVPGDEVLPGTDIRVLSDLVFYLAGMKAPRVRKSKLREDSEIVRLSLRDLLWYCYLDQASMESTLFHLESAAAFYMREKSKDVLRFVLGFHQEGVAELERDLDDVRVRRRATLEGARTLQSALDDADVGSEAEIDARIGAIRKETAIVEQEVRSVRDKSKSAQTHGSDELRSRARTLGEEIVAVEDAIGSIEGVVADEKRHLNELRTLSVRFRRSDAARAVLGGVRFQTCPSCTQHLPARDGATCPLCAQPELGANASQESLAVAENDADARQAELEESIKRHENQLRRFKRDVADRRISKAATDVQLSEALLQYDSLTMSSLVSLEHRRATLAQEQVRLERLRVLPARVSQMKDSVDGLVAEENRVLRELTAARAKAEGDAGSLRRLESLFLDSLVRSKLPGISADDIVAIEARNFYPQVAKPGEESVVVANHWNLSSGGKVTIFKCCYAIALHRLAREAGGLPSLLIIDTPMKNISERNDRAIFEAFYDMLYELMVGELAGTQLILVDKEYRPPPSTFPRKVFQREMTPKDPKRPPLIGYFRE
jgi:hypothetical protein